MGAYRHGACAEQRRIGAPRQIGTRTGFLRNRRALAHARLLKNTGTLINDMVTAPAAVLNGWLVARAQFPTLPNMRC